jgi:hypothetical protein
MGFYQNKGSCEAEPKSMSLMLSPCMSPILVKPLVEGFTKGKDFCIPFFLVYFSYQKNKH